MDQTLLIPPIAFSIVFVVISVLSYLFSKLSFKKVSSAESEKSYSCGEEFSGHLIQPDYGQFFPFAFFFTILHVVAMVIAIVPKEDMSTFVMALVYIIGAATALFILFRR